MKPPLIVMKFSMTYPALYFTHKTLLTADMEA